MRTFEKKKKPRVYGPRIYKTPLGQPYLQTVARRLPEPFNAFEWQFAGFHQRVSQLAAEDEKSDLQPDEVVVEFVPDAYFLDIENRELFLLEAVDTSDLSEAKIDKLTCFFWMLDYIDWKLSLFLCYPKHNGLMAVCNWQLIGHYALERFSDKKKPYTEALNCFKEKC